VRGEDWILRFIPSDQQAEAKALCKQQVGQQRGGSYTKAFIDCDGRLREVEWFHQDLVDNESRPTGILCIGRDVTELQSARHELLAAEQRYRAVLETAVNPIILMGEDCIIETVNSATESLFGYRREELIGQNVRILMPEPYASRHDGYVENYQRTGRRKIIGIGREAVARRKDGTVFPIDLSVGEVRLPDGRRFFTGIIRDLTARKQLEDQILRVSEEEQHRIGRDIHDDLCQQLAAIACLAKVVLQRVAGSDEGASEDLAEVVRLLTQANQRAREMSRGLVPVVLDSDGLMSALSDLARATQKIFRITCTFDSDPPVQVRDERTAVQLYRIAQEAVANSVKHSGADRLEIRLTELNDHILLSICDNGRGIPDHSAKEGTGMGLLTMSGRARMMGGDLSIENLELGGTLVTCSIPTPPSQENMSDQLRHQTRR